MSVIYEDETGKIEGFKNFAGTWTITRFEIFPKYRGIGLSYKLAEHLPQNAVLLACPDPGTLPKNKLILFYQNLGFVPILEDSSLMKREKYEDG